MRDVSALVVAVVAFCLGSLVAGIFYSRWRGQDIRHQDLPGGSGTYRQYGKGAAVLVTLLDVFKGALAVWFAQWYASDLTWLASFFVVLGHCYPLFFGFRGGGGIAPLLGALLVASPITLLIGLAFALGLIPIYKVTFQHKLKLNAIPVVAAVAVPVTLLVAMRFGGMADLIGGGLAMGIRALHMLSMPGQNKA